MRANDFSSEESGRGPEINGVLVESTVTDTLLEAQHRHRRRGMTSIDSDSTTTSSAGSTWHTETVTWASRP